MRNIGQACTAANRMFVHAGVAGDFVRRLGDRMASLVVGDGSATGVDVGPLIDDAARRKVLMLQRDAVDRGAELVAGGESMGGAGYFVQPTVLTGVTADAKLNDTEIFGPLAAVATFRDLDDAVRRANDTDSGLVGYVVTENLDTALDIGERLDVGMVGINTGLVSTPSAPFGGVKQSGLGREGGRVGIDEYLETKYLSVPVRR